VSWISKASAAQRAGRAGRTGPGHSYRLYSSAFYDRQMKDHFEPEILRVPIESTVLQMKAMNIPCISDFPFPTPPDREVWPSIYAHITIQDMRLTDTKCTHTQMIHQAARTLEILGALKYVDEYASESDREIQQTSKMVMYGEFLKADEERLHITDIGRTLLEYPIGVRCAKMLALGNQHDCLPYVIAIAAILSVEQIQLSPDELGKQIQHDQQTKKKDINNDDNNDESDSDSDSDNTDGDISFHMRYVLPNIVSLFQTCLASICV